MIKSIYRDRLNMYTKTLSNIRNFWIQIYFEVLQYGLIQYGEVESNKEIKVSFVINLKNHFIKFLVFKFT